MGPHEEREREREREREAKEHELEARPNAAKCHLVRFQPLRIE